MFKSFIAAAALLFVTVALKPNMPAPTPAQPAPGGPVMPPPDMPPTNGN